MITLVYFMCLIRLPSYCIYKRVFVYRYCYHMFEAGGTHSGPVYRFIHICDKYNILDVVRRAVEHCDYMSKDAWKKLVTNRIMEHEKKRWNVTKYIFKSAQLLWDTRDIELLSWWEVGQQDPSMIRTLRTIVRLLLNCHSLRTCLFKYNRSMSPLCDQCNMHKEEDVIHVLFVCPQNEDERNRLWSMVRDACSPALYRDIMNMSIEKRLSFMISGLNSNWVPEWKELYYAIAWYINTLYTARLCLSGE